MSRFLADSIVLFVAYVAAFLLRFDFGTPTWGWQTVLCGFGSAFVLGWAGLLLFRCHRLSPRTISLRNLPRFVGAVAFTVICQLVLRYVVLRDDASIVWRPPASVAVMAGVLALAGLLACRYVRRLQLRPIEVADLLGRGESEVNTPTVREGFAGKTVIITGAGGSIGSELSRQVWAAHPKRLILVELSEAALYQIHTQLFDQGGDTSALLPIVADCGDRALMRELLTRERPDFLLHAAAYKHVPMMERNPVEALRNNALATRTLAEEAKAIGVGTFVLISTDKAIHPVSSLGVSKRLAEIFMRDLTEDGKTRFCAVRFGNVLGSSGSVVPRFRQQIAKGGPVTVTDPRMERYFMTPSEAVGLILQAATFAKGGEIFVLDMGKPMTILSLAETMIRLSGLRPGKDIPIVFTGVRPGEKLTEELGVDATRAERTDHERIFVGHIPQLPHPAVEALLARCDTLSQSGLRLTPEDLRTLLIEEGNQP